jgi:hypothetical protein
VDFVCTHFPPHPFRYNWLQEKLDEHGQGKWKGKQKGTPFGPLPFLVNHFFNLSVHRHHEHRHGVALFRPGFSHDAMGTFIVVLATCTGASSIPSDRMIARSLSLSLVYPEEKVLSVGDLFLLGDISR